MHHQLLLDGTSTRIIVAGGRTIRQRGGFTLIARRDQARLGVTVEGLYADGWLAGSGSMTIYATGRPGLCRDATLHLTLPRRHSPVRITIAEAGGRRSIVVNPGSTSVVSISGSSIYRRTLVLRAATWTIVGTPRLRTISVKALLSTRVASCTGYRE
jgi:hypothetical protein